MKFLIAIFLIQATAFASVQSKNSVNCEILMRPQKALTLKLKLSADDKLLKEIFEGSSHLENAPRSNGVSRWRHVSKDTSLEAVDDFGGIMLNLSGIEFLSANQFGNRDCRFTGRSADALFEVLRDVESDMVRKSKVGVRGVGTEVSLLDDQLSCVDRIYGSGNEPVMCTLRPKG